MHSVSAENGAPALGLTPTVLPPARRAARGRAEQQPFAVALDGLEGHRQHRAGASPVAGGEEAPVWAGRWVRGAAMETVGRGWVRGAAMEPVGRGGAGCRHARRGRACACSASLCWASGCSRPAAACGRPWPHPQGHGPVRPGGCQPLPVQPRSAGRGRVAVQGGAGRSAGRKKDSLRPRVWVKETGRGAVRGGAGRTGGRVTCAFAAPPKEQAAAAAEQAAAAARPGIGHQGEVAAREAPSGSRVLGRLSGAGGGGGRQPRGIGQPPLTCTASWT